MDGECYTQVDIHLGECAPLEWHSSPPDPPVAGYLVARLVRWIRNQVDQVDQVDIHLLGGCRWTQVDVGCAL